MGVTGRDIVVIGGSAGGVTALREIVAGLPKRLPATLFVVVHRPSASPSRLPELLNKLDTLPSSHAVDQQRFQPGHIYVAPPDRHLLLSDGTMRVTLGPREHGFRPAVDPLFRTAAEHHGARVIGVILSGALDDGTRGLQAVKRAGGVAIVQDIEDATVRNMPLSAIRNVQVDHIAHAAAIAALIQQGVAAEAPFAPA